MSNKKNNSGPKTAAALIIGGLLGAGIAYVGSKIKSYFEDADKEKEEVKPIPPQNRGVSLSGNMVTAVDSFHCPISLEEMSNPAIIIKCSHTFEKTNIVEWIEKHGRCPICNTEAALTDIKSNYNLKNAILEIRKN